MVKEALTSTYQKVLGHSKYHHKEWISIETLDKIRERKNKTTAINNTLTKTKKIKAQVKYTAANKQVKRRIRAASQNYEEDLATTADKAAKEGNMKLAGNYKKTERPVEDKENKTITDIQEHRNRW
ncbi:unnamed protein product [Schistosoma mattheei]|uniref:Uncharacterized protein n=1 Tax=Schistosoma mattheei TaxID=31246 RepID=A0A183NSA5_9TREM|nr:unnamed protein product [Schistosoma mattheei]